MFPKPLPKIMVAPNGARRTKTDHPTLPVTIGETVQTAAACFAAGASGLHAHVRDQDQKHVLDAGLYRELISEMAISVPKMQVQITTEAIGIYSAAEQRQLVKDVMPENASVSLTEMLGKGEVKEASEFYLWARDNEVAIQHILYEPADLTKLVNMVDAGSIPADGLQLIFVLGRYTPGQQSSPDDLQPYLEVFKHAAIEADWAICAFGKGETACLGAALKAGGKARVGFENSLWNADGSLAKDNAERVSAIAELA